MIQVTCKQCLIVGYITDGRNVHDAAGCGCCAEDHDHAAHPGQEECSAQNHPGVPCWQGPQAGPRPDGCGVCKPLHIRLMAPMTPAGG